MKPPPIPDNFGNYALADFAEVHAPADISWWPQTAGWLWLGTVLAVYLLYRSGRALRHWRRNRYRREARQRLTRLSRAAEGSSLVTAASEILKVTALAVFPRTQVARLSGRDWISFLNSRCEEDLFDVELATLMAEAQYQCTPPTASQQAALLQACQRWVVQHRGPEDA